MCVAHDIQHRTEEKTLFICSKTVTEESVGISEVLSVLCTLDRNLQEIFYGFIFKL